MNVRERMLRAVLRAQRQGECAAFVEPAIAAGQDRHKANIANLYRNLEPQAAGRLSDILRRREKLLAPSVNSYRDLYTEDEYYAFERVESFSKEIFQDGASFRYQDFRLPIRNFEAAVFLHHHGLETLKTLDSISGKAIMDVGAFICDSALVFRKLLPACAVYCFEPNAGNFALARETLRLNGLQDDAVILENLALGNKTGLAAISKSAYAGAHILDNPSAGQSVEMDTLDDYVARRDLSVGMIKVDVEGFEQRFLRGALETIKTQRPILLLSIYHNYDDFFQIKPLIEELHLGYKFDFFKGIDSSVWADILLLCEVP
jgi:FkbM family methyltransferase